LSSKDFSKASIQADQAKDSHIQSLPRDRQFSPASKKRLSPTRERRFIMPKIAFSG